jgi:ACS family hexuronate transporter-like MFS transporter
VLCFTIAQTTTPTLALACISVAMFCHAAWANMTLPTELLPANAIGSVTGLAGALGGVMGVITQTAIGWTVQHVSFTPVFFVAAFVHLTALGGVVLLAGKLGQPNAAPA